MNRYRNWKLLLGVAVALVVIGGGITAYMLLHNTPAVAQGRNCGSFTTNGQRTFGAGQHSTAAQIADCFWQAYQQCQTASMHVTFMGVDAGTQHVFTLQKQQNGCQVVDTSQFYNVNFGGSHSKPETNVCASLTRTQSALHFSQCGQNGDVVVPIV